MLFPASAVGAASAHPHRRATLFVRGLRQTIHAARPLEHAPEAARASPQAGACLSKLRQGVCYSRLPEGNMRNCTIIRFTVFSGQCYNPAVLS